MSGVVAAPALIGEGALLLARLLGISSVAEGDVRNFLRGTFRPFGRPPNYSEAKAREGRHEVQNPVDAAGGLQPYLRNLAWDASNYAAANGMGVNPRIAQLVMQRIANTPTTGWFDVSNHDGYVLNQAYHSLVDESKYHTLPSPQALYQRLLLYVEGQVRQITDWAARADKVIGPEAPEPPKVPKIDPPRPGHANAGPDQSGQILDDIARIADDIGEGWPQESFPRIDPEPANPQTNIKPGPDDPGDPPLVDVNLNPGPPRGPNPFPFPPIFPIGIGGKRDKNDDEPPPPPTDPVIDPPTTLPPVVPPPGTSMPPVVPPPALPIDPSNPGRTMPPGPADPGMTEDIDRFFHPLPPGQMLPDPGMMQPKVPGGGITISKPGIGTKPPGMIIPKPPPYRIPPPIPTGVPALYTAPTQSIGVNHSIGTNYQLTGPKDLGLIANPLHGVTDNHVNASIARYQRSRAFRYQPY